MVHLHRYTHYTYVLCLFLSYVLTWNVAVHAQFDVYVNQFRCFDRDSITPNADRSYGSLCQYSESCTAPPEAAFWQTAPDNFNASAPHVKRITCPGAGYNGQPFVLTYNYTQQFKAARFDGYVADPQQRCSYRIEYTDCQKTMSATIDARTVWEYTKLLSDDLHADVSPPTTGESETSDNELYQTKLNALDTLCNIMTNDRARLQCIIPFEKEHNPQSQCVLRNNANFFCHEHQFQCTRDQSVAADVATCANVFYHCNTSSPLILDARCSRVDLTMMRALIDDSARALTTSVANRLTAYPTCTAMRTQVCKVKSSFPGNRFVCNRPWSESAENGDFCNLSPNYRNVQPHCGGKGFFSRMTCFSNNLENGTHTCLAPLHFDFLQQSLIGNSESTVVNTRGLSRPELNVSCTIPASISAHLFANLYSNATALRSAVFPPITLQQYEQLFCITTFRACPLWQISAAVLQCDDALRTQLGLDNVTTPAQVARRRLLAILDEHPLSHEDVVNLYSGGDVLSSNVQAMLRSWQRPLEMSNPSEIGNSACNSDARCNSAMMRYRDATLLSHQLQLLAAFRTRQFTEWNSDKQTVTEQQQQQQHGRHLLQTNDSVQMSSESDDMNTDDVDEDEYEDDDDDESTLLYRNDNWEGLRYIEEYNLDGTNVRAVGDDDNPPTSGRPRRLLSEDENPLAWTKTLYQRYMDMWCAYGRAEQEVCGRVAEQCYARENDGQIFNCNGTGVSVGLSPQTYCSSFANIKCAINGRTDPVLSFQCPASHTTMHDIRCTLKTPVRDCEYFCSVHNPLLVTANVVMFASELVDMQDVSQKCQLFNRRWQSIETSTAVAVNVTSSLQFATCMHDSQTRMHDRLCYASVPIAVSWLQCGVMSIACTKQSSGNTALYTCSSESTHAEVTARCSASTGGSANRGLYVTDLPWSAVARDSSLDLNVQCNRLRKLARDSGEYCCDSNAHNEPFLEPAGICRGRFAGAMNQTVQFQCPRDTSSTVHTLVDVTCKYSTFLETYKCQGTNDNVQHTFSCSEIDPVALNAALLTRDSVTGISNQACQLMARQCHTSVEQRNDDYYNCPLFTHRMDYTASGDACVLRTSAYSPHAQTVNRAIGALELPVFTCGTLPARSIYCSNAVSGSEDWLRCSHNATRVGYTGSLSTVHTLGNSVFQMDCLYRAAMIQETLKHQDPNGRILALCSQLLTQCMPFECAEQSGALSRDPLITPLLLSTQSISVPAENQTVFGDLAHRRCPAPIVQSIQCSAPGQLCNQVFCQDEVAAAVASSTALTLTGSSFSRINPFFSACSVTQSVQNITCNGYEIVCTRMQSNIVNIFDVQYRCTHAGPPTKGNHVQDVGTFLSSSSYTSPKMYHDAEKSLNRVDIQDAHTLQMDCIIDSVLLSTTAGYVNDLNLQEECSTEGAVLNQAQCDKLQICKQIGQSCLVNDQAIACGNNGVATFPEPYCVESYDIPSLNDTAFLCNGLMVQCYLPEQCSSLTPQGLINDCVVAVSQGMAFCTSSSRTGVKSEVWELQANLNGLQNVLNTQPSFHSNSTVDASFLYGSGRIDGLVGCELPYPFFYQNKASRCQVLYSNCAYECLNPNYQPALAQVQPGGDFCEVFSYQHTEFTCDDQWITCSLENPVTSNSNDASSEKLGDYVDPDYAYNQRTMRCKSYTPQVENSAAPFNQTLFLDCQVNNRLFVESTETCSTLLAQCRANGGKIQCADGYVSTKDAPLCTVKREEVTASADCNCGTWWSTYEGQNQWPAALQHELFTCKQRGYVSVPDYIAAVGSTLTLAQIQATEPYKVHWCLHSVERPVAVCATVPGQRLPLCTVECPLGLQARKLHNSNTTYCMKPNYASIDEDMRQCVLGQHDVSLFVAAPHLFPDHKCPANIMESHTIYPLSVTLSSSSILTQSLMDTNAQSRHLCEMNPACTGFTLVRTGDGSVGVYFSHRPLQLSRALLVNDDPQRLHHLDTQASYHLHPVRDDVLDTQGSLLAKLSPRSVTRVQGIDTFILERSYGYRCTDHKLDVLHYLNSDLATRMRVQARFDQHLLLAGASPQMLSKLRYNPNTNALGDIFTGGLHSIPGNEALLTVDLAQQIAYDLRQPYSFADNNGIDIVNATTYIRAQIGLREANNQASTYSLGNAAYPSLYSTPLRAMIPEDSSSPVLSVSQAFKPEHDVNVVNTCSILSVEPPTNVQRYQWLNIRKHNSFVRYNLPLFGNNMNEFKGRVYVYTRAAPAAFVQMDTLHTMNFATDKKVVGVFQIVHDDIRQVSFSNFGTVFYYMAWHDWTIYGHRVPRGFERLSPNAQCNLKTPLWIDTVLSEQALGQVERRFIDLSGTPSYTALAQVFEQHGAPDKLPFPLCAIARCPLPLDHTVWINNTVVNQRDTSSALPLSRLYPNPPSALLYARANSIPCSADHGVCRATLGGVAGSGHCECHPSFKVHAPISPFMSPTLNEDAGFTSFRSSIVPRSLKEPSCPLDIRQTCIQPVNGQDEICHDNGECVFGFEGQKQISRCECGSFQDSCEESLDPDACAKAGKPFVYNGFKANRSATAPVQCQVPREVCRFDYDASVGYRRLSSTYEPDDSYGCEMPRMNEARTIPTGTCFAFNANDAQSFAGCDCKSGRYGRYCEYVSLDGGCYNSTGLLQRKLQTKVSADSKSTLCVFNPHLLQYETMESTSIPDNLIASYTKVPCRQIICSNRGRCTHQGMDSPRADLYVPANAAEASNIRDHPYFMEQDSVRTLRHEQWIMNVQYRMIDQHCVCPVGFTGAYCEYRDCIGGCGRGYCVRSLDDTKAPYCECPRSRSGALLVTGPQCDEFVCGAHGDLRLIDAGVRDERSLLPSPVYKPDQKPIYACACTAPYYQGSNLTQICQMVCDKGVLEKLSPASITSTNSLVSISAAVTKTDALVKQVIAGSSTTLGKSKKTTVTPAVSSTNISTVTIPSPPPTFASSINTNTLDATLVCVCRNVLGLTVECSTISTPIYLSYNGSSSSSSSSSSGGSGSSNSRSSSSTGIVNSGSTTNTGANSVTLQTASGSSSSSSSSASMDLHSEQNGWIATNIPINTPLIAIASVMLTTMIAMYVYHLYNTNPSHAPRRVSLS